jgi:hypothetical protein
LNFDAPCIGFLVLEFVMNFRFVWPALIVFGVVALTACTTSKKIQGPSGGPAYFIKCPPAAIQSCYEEAALVCPKGYTFADKGEAGPGIIMPAGRMYMMGPGPNTMLVECKE